MRVWIDQDLCTGDGLCAEIAPAVFDLHDDGLAYVKGIGQTALCGPNGEPVNQGTAGKVDVAENMKDSVIESADECPGECIFIET